MEKFFSICIPSYNRPNDLKRLLESIDYNKPNEFEIIICEDKSPKRKEIRKKVNLFKETSNYEVKYYENNDNLGFDKNLRELIRRAQGEYIIFMGDDDEFIPNGLDNFIDFLKDNDHLGYVLKRARKIHYDNKIEEFRYYNTNRFFDKGYNSYTKLFRRSVFISGFTFKRRYSLPFLIDDLDGTLLYQIYILAEITLEYPSAYCDILLTQEHEGGTPYFGSSENENSLYEPGKVTMSNSINFIKGFLRITKFLDEKYGFDSTEEIKLDMSKYSYPLLSIQRNKGIKDFYIYFKKLKKLNLNKSIYFYIYFFGLLILGEKNCDNIILLLKKILKKSPNL